ncbi:serine/arginine repetitive matrix protein 1 isoform X1 [Oncorhynchus mykiss]|uniref:serine/arginine repetitive matrix protein 1 isoform X1 n=1 Tax=Oncorhynchus mykiss TaxID=8022 RepID=UPI0018776A8A|nr:serine/arginine repetitive matrix protein 1 isoform X1 [Oncorhynchus mykiss]
MPKMVRHHSGPPRFKPRSYSGGYNNTPHEEHYSPHLGSQRGFRGHRGKAPPSWRGRGHAHFAKSPTLMGERRERQFNHWRSQNQDSFNTCPSQSDPHHGHRRAPPSRPNCPPQAQHRSSPHSPAQWHQGQRGAPIHGQHPGHRSPSPHHYHSQHPDRRLPPSPSTHSSFMSPHKHPGPSHEEDRSWGARPHHSPGKRLFEHPGRGGKRWNGPGPFPHPHNSERGPSCTPQKKPREFHGRGPYPERYRSEEAVWAGWSAERDPRQQHGVVGREREGSRRRSAEWAQEGSFHHPPHRSPAWKGVSSSFYQNSPQERPSGQPHKRNFQECGPGLGLEHGHPKCPRREISQTFSRGFGGRPLSLMDKSRLMKGRQIRAESVMRLKAPPLRPRGADIENQEEEGPHASRANARSKFALRQERFQAKAGPLRKRPITHQSPAKSSRNSESHKEHVDSQRALSTHSSSSIDRRLARDLVVVSQWQAPGTNSSSKDSPPRDRSRPPKNKTEPYYNSDEQLTLNERFSKIHDSSPSPSPRDWRYAERQTDMPQENHTPERPFRNPRSPQRPSFRPSSPNHKPGPPPQRKPGPELPGPFRKPLMGGFVPRPFSQRPVFRKSQSILSKYRNMPTMRQRVPPNRGSNYRRW